MNRGRKSIPGARGGVLL